MNPQRRRDYDRNRWQQRRKKLIDLLSGKCFRCGITEDLTFDHIDPKTKNFGVSSGLFKPWAILLSEIAKCQLLCLPCHTKKTAENGDIYAVEHGGGLSGKKNCPCKPCRDRKSEYNRAYRQAHKGGSPNGRASGLHPEDMGSIPVPPTGS